MNEEERKPTPEEAAAAADEACEAAKTQETIHNTPMPDLSGSEQAGTEYKQEDVKLPAETQKPERTTAGEYKIPLLWAVPILCCMLVISILTTYLFTSALWRNEYLERLEAQQQSIQSQSPPISAAASNMQLLESVVELYSYYADQLDGNAMLEAAFKAYVEASGDRYAQYYTEEEYLKILKENNAEYCGIGVSVVNTTIQVNGTEQLVFQITEIYESSPASSTNLRAGDYLYAIEVDGAFETVSALGYNGAVAAIRGEENTALKARFYRPDSNNEYHSLEISFIRAKYETTSVKGRLAEGNNEIGIVTISSFDLKTPRQLKATVNGMLESGVKHFVFDVRGNPGGDLQSIKAVLSYFLQKGDLVLSAIDKDGSVAASYCVEPTSFSGDYAACSVSEYEIGMYRDLSMVVLCDENTASAAEVFTATMQDYELATVIGVTTFGKGIMQSTKRIPFANIVGYIKLTTYAYKTNREESYHDVGIQPDIVVELSDEAKNTPLSILPQSQDAQLQTALSVLLNTIG